MAKVKIQGHASGTGVLTITAPNTSTDRTITLPDTTGTLLDENSSVPAANLTGTVADARFPATLPAVSAANLTSIPAATPSAGDVVQVVTFSSTGGSNDGGAFTYQDTHLVSAITPQYSNSKIIVASILQVYMNNTSGECSVGVNYKRAIAGGATTDNLSSDVADSTSQHRSFGNGEDTNYVSYTMVDAPSTTSAVTYTLRINGTGSANTVWGWQGKPDTLILTEVKV
jgi:hypothetical protein